MKFFQANKPNGATSERRFFFPSEYHSFSSGDLISGRANITSVRLAVVYGCVSLIAGKISTSTMELSFINF